MEDSSSAPAYHHSQVIIVLVRQLGVKVHVHGGITMSPLRGSHPQGPPVSRRSVGQEVVNSREGGSPGVCVDVSADNVVGEVAGEGHDVEDVHGDAGALVAPGPVGMCVGVARNDTVEYRNGPQFGQLDDGLEDGVWTHSRDDESQQSVHLLCGVVNELQEKQQV